MASRHTSRLLTAAALATLTFTAAACSDSGSGKGDSAGKQVTLTFWGSYGNGGNKEQTDALNKTAIPAFEKANPNIKVNYVDVPYDSLLQKLTTGAAGSRLPDLVRSDVGWGAKLGALKVFAPLDQRMSDFQTLAAATYPGILATNRYGDHYYGLPLDTNTRVLISNPAVLKEAGGKPPATFEDLKALAPKLAAKKIAVFADSGLQGWNVFPWIWSAGGAVTNPEQTKASGFLDSPASVAGVQVLVDLYKAGAVPDLITGDKGAVQTSDGLPKGKYAGILDGPWMTGVWSGQYPDFKPVYSPMPSGPGGSISVAGGENIVMTSASKHQDAALKFIRFTQTADFQLAMAKAGQMSVIKALADQEAKLVPAFAPFIKQLATAKARPAVPQSAQIDTVLQNELTAAFQGKVSVQQALTKAARQIDPLLTATQ